MLGEQNASLIVDILNVQDYDESRKRACCPFHLEDTPSWIYHDKEFYFKCFGCGIRTDIIEAYKQTGLSTIDAVRELYQKVGFDDSFSEQGVRTKRDYVYPELEPDGDKTTIREFLNKRRISNETIDYADVRQDKDGNVVFNYYDSNDVLLTVKYRLSYKPEKGTKREKTWCQQNRNTTPILFNMNRINPTLPLLICEGEIDCLSAIEAGYKNSVSIPFGAKNAHWINENWDWLEQFEHIIICGDADPAGKWFRDESVHRLGAWRCRAIEFPLDPVKLKNNTYFTPTDLNEYLYFYGKEATLSLIINAAEAPVESIVGFSDIQDIDLDEIDGIYTGIKEFDEEMMRLFYGSFNIVTGINGAGKSSFLSQLVCQSIEQDKHVWLYSKELPNYMTKNWINSILAGPRHTQKYLSRRGAEYYKVPMSVKCKIDESLGNDKLVVYRDEWPNTIAEVKESMEVCVRRYGIKLFIVDNMTAINFGCSETEKWAEQLGFVNWLIEFAQKFHVVTMLVIHPKKIDTMRRLTKLDVQGLGSLVDMAHRLISLYRVQPNEKEGIKKFNGDWKVEPVKYDVQLDVLKDRLRGREGHSFGLYYDRPSKRFYTNQEEYAYQYRWDTEEYGEALVMPDSEEELFGLIKEDEALEKFVPEPT